MPNKLKLLNHSHAFYLSLALNFLITGYFFYYAWEVTGGQNFYALDDAYIHMAVAQNFAQKGVWGISVYEFSSTTSSPLYTLLLAGLFKVFGSHMILPFIFNCLLAGVFLWQLFRFGARYLSPQVYLALALALTFLLPLPPLITIGMEATLHIVLAFWLFTAAWRALQYSPPVFGRQFWLLCLAAALAVMVRYESLFLIAAISFIFLIRRQFMWAFLPAIAGALTVVIYGLISMFHGSLFFPNPLLIKSSISEISLLSLLEMLWKGKNNLMYSPSLLCLAILISGIFIGVYRSHPKIPRVRLWILVIPVITILLHTLLASGGTVYWLIRYEAYLVTIGGLAIASMGDWIIREWRQWEKSMRWALYVLLFPLFLPFGEKAFRSLVVTPRCIKNIYEQQCQMAQFLHQYYPTASVAANDIGAISYFTEIQLFDLIGLGSVEIIQNKHLPKKEVFTQVAAEKGVQIALIYIPWFGDNIPDHWKPVGSWTIPDNYICGDPTVTFFAVDPAQEDTLSHALKEFTPNLPQGVEVWIAEN